MDSGLPNTGVQVFPLKTQEERRTASPATWRRFCRCHSRSATTGSNIRTSPAEGRSDGETAIMELSTSRTTPWEILVNRMTKVNGIIDSITPGKIEIV